MLSKRVSEKQREHCECQWPLYQHFQPWWRPINFNQKAVALVVEIPNTAFCNS